MTAASCDFLVARDDMHRTQWQEGPAPADVPLQPGQALLRVDAFALTANNVTYGVFGDAMRYWDFFPAPAGWGRIPVWGHATVLRANGTGLADGERVYGYLPMSTHLVVQVSGVTAGSFSETSPHRRELSAIYNTYSRCAADPAHDPARESERMLHGVLFLTGFLIDDFLADNGFFGARSVIVASASSKTAIGTAFCLAKHGRDACEVVGLTSKANRDFVESLGCYHRVVTYDEIATLPASTPSVFVDMAGDGSVTGAVHTHFGDNLRYSCSVGGTHWSNLAFGQSFPGPVPTLFFAPAQVDKRMVDWGPEGLQKKMSDAWKEFLPHVAGWISVQKVAGREGVEKAWLDTLDGRANPRVGLVLSI